MSELVRAQPGRSWVTLPRVGGSAALITDAILLLGVVGLAIQQQGLGVKNWLIVLFQINSGSLRLDSLRVFNPIDVAVLALVGLTFLGLWPRLGRLHRIWMGIAIAMPFAGIAVLIVTGLSGRTAVMGAGVIFSGLMLVSLRNRRWLALTGLVANGLLLIGDFGTGLLPGALLTAPIAAGYPLLLGWYGWLAVTMFNEQRKQPHIVAT